MGVASYTIKTDSTSTTNTVYIGRCNSIDADDNSPMWSIQRVTLDGDNVTIENANGENTPNNVWANRTTLEYK